VSASRARTPASVPAVQGPSVVRLLALLLQIGLFLVAVYLYDIESRAFLHLGILTFFGFAVHYWLPLRLRLPFFVLLSLFGIFLVFGFQEETWNLNGLAQAAWIIALGLGLIGLCHLPVSFAARGTLLLATGATLCFLRADRVALPWSSAIWPVFGSMFMFRLILYFDYLRHEKKEPATFLQTLAYFFMLPNVCFPLFPVVDFKSFRRSYYDQPDRHAIYQTGASWLFRGLLHLILYRFAYKELVIGTAEVTDVTGLLQYLLWPFLLYLRVSGMFHVVVGMLLLFGFNLPETHHLYYLASSFTDHWRRTNIYWKDFMMKVFYYPAFFKLRKLGNTRALVLSTMYVFLATWLLHAYQWYWIRGTFLTTWNDGLFWTLFGAIVVANVLYETKHGRQRVLTERTIPWRRSCMTALSTLGTFCSIAMLWSFWRAESVGEWLSIWRVLGDVGPGDARALGWLLALVLAIGVPSLLLTRGGKRPPLSFQQSALRTALATGVLVLIATPGVYLSVPGMRKTVDNLLRDELNDRDFAQLERGYYENLLSVGQFNPELWEVYRTRPADWRVIQESEAVVHRHGIPSYELVPSRETKHNGALVVTNRWGMRDRDYTKERPPGTQRFALLGSSFVMGSGVENPEIFDNQLEELLARAVAGQPGTGGPQAYEILNFAVAGYTGIEQVALVEQKIFEFEPDAVLYVEHARADEKVIGHVIVGLQEGWAQQYELLADVAARAGVDPSAERWEIRRKLEPFATELMTWCYERVADACRARGVPALWIFWPRPETEEQVGSPGAFERDLAEKAGFEIVDLTSLYSGQSLKKLWVARWDHHPNALGHRLLAERLFERLFLDENGKLRSARAPGSPGETAHSPSPASSKDE
jgi:hypothetical protein